MNTTFILLITHALQSHTCTDPESFDKGGPTFVVVFCTLNFRLATSLLYYEISEFIAQNISLYGPMKPAHAQLCSVKFPYFVHVNKM